MVTKRRNGSLSKTARMMFLLRMQEEGKLLGKSKSKLAELLSVSRFTLYRDLDDLNEFESIYKNLIQKVEQS